MDVLPWETVEPETVEEAPGVRIHWVIDRRRGAPRFAMRVFELDPGAKTPWHSHWYEQEMYMLEGVGEVRGEEGTRRLEPGTVVFVRPHERHEFRNVGDGVFRFLCVIPLPPEAEGGHPPR